MYLEGSHLGHEVVVDIDVCIPKLIVSYEVMVAGSIFLGDVLSSNIMSILL